MTGGVKGRRKTPSAYGRKDRETGLNPKQEAFCQHFVRNWDYVAAYKEAGYDCSPKPTTRDEDHLKRTIRRSAICLANRPAVKERLDVLQKEQTIEHNKNLVHARATLSDKYQMNLEKLTLLLLEDRHFARTGELKLPDQPEPVRNPNERWGQTAAPGTPAYPGYPNLHAPVQTSDSWRPDARAAVQATMGLAKLHGLLIDKAEITVQGSITRMSNDELLSFIQKCHEQIGPVIDVTPTPGVEYLPWDGKGK